MSWFRHRPPKHPPHRPDNPFPTDPSPTPKPEEKDKK